MWLKSNNGEDAYQMIMDKKPDIVLLDVIMPKLDGITVLEKIRARTAAKICRSHHGDRGRNETCISGIPQCASYYILKPFDRKCFSTKSALCAGALRTKMYLSFGKTCRYLYEQRRLHTSESGGRCDPASP